MYQHNIIWLSEISSLPPCWKLDAHCIRVFKITEFEHLGCQKDERAVPALQYIDGNAPVQLE